MTEKVDPILAIKALNSNISMIIILISFYVHVCMMLASMACTPRPLLDTHYTIGNTSFKVPDYTLDILLPW